LAGAQRAVELILMRRWASYITLPVFFAGVDGKLLYFNDAAAALLGRPFDVAGDMPVDRLDALFATATEDGQPLASDDLPIHVALMHRVPCHRRFRIAALDGVSRLLDVTALPIEGQGGRFLGAMTVFWEVKAP
jgi:hypothetical protein